MNTVEEILEQKGREVWTVAPDDSVGDALLQMAHRGIGALVVVEGDRVVGIISERDFARRVVGQDTPSLLTVVAEMMIREPRCVTPDQSIADCMALMTDKRVRHLPVLDGERLAGVLSIGDLVKSIIEAQGSKIDELESLIYGS